MENFRDIKSSEELRLILGRSTDPEVGIVWQNTHHERLLIPLIRIEFQDKKVIFHSSQKIEFHRNLPIFFKINHRSLLFKVVPGEFDFFKKQLACPYPEDAKGFESRIEFRTAIAERSHITLTLRSLSNITIMDSSIQLLDYSQSGIGGTISRVNEDFFLRSNFFQIIKVGQFSQIELPVLSLKHITDPGGGKKLKIGFSLEASLSSKFFEYLKLELEKTLIV